ncbi:Protein of unknown function D [Prunus dulcis]|uniref:Uncharacterized protein n=1 Tax=Prunus dulcis TaxID=3755 RepID=A0A4Y1S006_PRUDU|nr:Protein of unknown function D [Prunus dulcis]
MENTKRHRLDLCTSRTRGRPTRSATRRGSAGRAAAARAA